MLTHKAIVNGEMIVWDGTNWDVVGQVASSAITAVRVTTPVTVDNTDPHSPIIGISVASGTAAGALSAADKTKLDGIAAGAQVNVKPDWNAAAGNAAEILNKADNSCGLHAASGNSSKAGRHQSRHRPQGFSRWNAQLQPLMVRWFSRARPIQQKHHLLQASKVMCM